MNEKRLFQKSKKVIRDTRGMSLVELIVSVAILVILGGAILSFFSVAVLQSTSLDTDGTMHIESQMTWNQLRNDIQNTNGGMHTDASGHTLVLYRKYDNGNAEKTIYSYDSANEQIVYRFFTASNSSPTWVEDPDGEQVFAGFVAEADGDDETTGGIPVSFTILDASETALSDATATDETVPHSVKVDLQFANGNKSMDAARNVYLRNTVVWVPDSMSGSADFLF